MLERFSKTKVLRFTAIFLFFDLCLATGARAQIVPITDGIQQSLSSSNTTVRWNANARALVKKNLVDPLWAARAYALVSVAQYGAAKQIHELKKKNSAEKEALITAAIASSSATMLAHLFPHEVPRISANLDAQLRQSKTYVTASDLKMAKETGESTALLVIRKRENDGSNRLDTIDQTPVSGIWQSSEKWPPLRPFWGEVQTFIIKNIEDYDPPPPPANDSTAFLEALAAVRQARRVDSAYNEEIAKKWTDGPGTATPTGHWNDIGVELILRFRTGELESARVLAHLNMALMDTSIVCWRTKFKYLLPRPPQVDERIVPSFPLPNFPSYPSGHAAFSGAAATFLSRVFPTEKSKLEMLADEAARSRFVSGIHYPFDCDVGLNQGRKVANYAITLFDEELKQSSSRTDR